MGAMNPLSLFMKKDEKDQDWLGDFQLIFKTNGKNDNLRWIEENLKQDAEDEENAADGMEKLQKQLLCLHWAKKITGIHEFFNFSVFHVKHVGYHQCSIWRTMYKWLCGWCGWCGWGLESFVDLTTCELDWIRLSRLSQIQCVNFLLRLYFVYLFRTKRIFLRFAYTTAFRLGDLRISTIEKQSGNSDGTLSRQSCAEKRRWNHVESCETVSRLCSMNCKLTSMVGAAAGAAAGHAYNKWLWFTLIFRWHVDNDIERYSDTSWTSWTSWSDVMKKRSVTFAWWND